MFNNLCFFVLLIFFFSNDSFSMFNGEEDEQKFKKKSFPEGFLKKDEPHFTEKDGHPYVSQKAFDNIHPVAKGSNINPSSMQINSYSDRELSKGEFASGSGTILKSDGEKFEGVTALHVMFDKEGQAYRSGKIFQAQGMYGNNLNYLASGRIDKVCPSIFNRDLALIKGRYEAVTKEEQKFLTQTPASFTTCKNRGILVGHPLGVKEQRIREGDVFCNKERHQISSLPADSGGGLYSADEKLFGVHTGGPSNSKYTIKEDIQIENTPEQYGEYQFNQFHLFNQKDYLQEFPKCFNVNNKYI